MKWKRVLLIGVCVAISVLVALGFLLWPRPQTRYGVLFLPDLYGVPVTPQAINDRGQVTGVAEVQPGQWHIWQWDKDTGLRDLGWLQKPRLFWKLQINNAGQIAGTTADPNGNEYAFLQDPNGVRHIFRPPNGEQIYVHDLNNGGRIVGRLCRNNVSRQGFIWDRTAGLRDVVIPGAVASVASGINDLGQIVGSYQVKPFGPWNAFFLDPNTGVQDLGPVGVGPMQQCHINNQGFVTGRFGHRDKSALSVWTREGGLQRLCPDKRAAVQVNGLNEANCLVALTNQRRFVLRELCTLTCLDSYLWDPNEGFVELARVLGRRDVIEFFASDINNEGQIVGLLRLRNEPNPLGVLLQPVSKRAAE